MLKYSGAGSQKSVRIRLPLAIIGFVKPVVVQADRFFTLWDDLAYTEIKNVVPLRHAFRPSHARFELEQCVKANGSFALLPNIDEKASTFVLACVMKGHGEIIVRVEIGEDGGRQEGLCLVSTRSKNRVVCQAVHNSMLELLVECNPLVR